MDVTLKRNIEERQKDLKNIELLIAAGRGDVHSVAQLTQENADVNFIDKDGNTAVHYAVRSNNLDVVNFLLDHMENTDAENKENETPLDIASRLSNETIINALGKKVMEKSFRLLEDVVTDNEADESALIHTNDALTEAEAEVRNTEDKIKYCLEAINKVKISKCSEEKLSYEQANVLIYFIEAFALEGYGVENTDVSSEVKRYFSQYYSDDDRENIICDARHLLFKNPNKIIRLQDVDKFIIGDVKSFFEKLKKYVQCVHDKLSFSSYSNEINLSSFFNVLKKEDRNIGDKINNTRSFLKTEFEKLIRAAYGKQKITAEVLFSFTMNFYPAFQNETNGDFKELSLMRNKLIHEFHKYGNVEFRNAIYSLRSRLFKYYYAQEVLKITNTIELDENPETISKHLNMKLVKFNEQFKTGYGTEQVISQEDAKGSLGYVFSHSTFPERDDSVEYLVDQYLKFMIIIDSEKKEEYDLSDTGREEEGRFDPNETDHEQKPLLYKQKELRDVDRREIFEKFCRLQRIKSYCNRGYSEEKQKLRDELMNTYGINGNHFDRVSTLYIEQNNQFNERDKITVEEIAKSINTLKKIKDNYKLSNQVIIALLDGVCEKQGFSFVEENHRLFTEMDQRAQQEIRNEFPRNKTLEISIGNDTFCIHTGKIVSNMLKTFYNAYHKYQVEFNVEEIFNDDIFLDYLVRTEIKDKDIAETLDPHFKVLAFICSRKQRERQKNETRNNDDVDVSELFRIFKTLKKYKKHSGDQDYCNQKEMLKTEIVDKNVWFNGSDFEKLCELFIEKNHEFEEEIKEGEKIKETIKKLKSIGFSWQVIETLCEKLLDGEGKLNLEDLSFLRNADMPRKTKVKKQLEKIYADYLLGSEIDITLGNESIKLHIFTVIIEIIKAFKDERNIKNSFFTYMVIKKLLDIHYCAPYIVKLITSIKNDNIIEKNDLLKLVDVLLHKEDGLFIKHLISLLSIRSGKLNLHEEICKKILECNVNIENMSIMLKEPDQLNKILNILRNKIGPPRNSGKKIADFMKKVLKLLNSIALEMYSGLKYDSALKILSKTNTLEEKMVQCDLIEKTDLNILETQFLIGKIKNRLGRQEPEKPKKTKLHAEALVVFDKIYITLRYKETSGEERDIKAHEMPLFLLVLSKIAYTEQLLEKYEKSCAESENLCQAVVRFALDLPKRNRLPDDFLNDQTYSEIEKSKNYQELLDFSEECKKYLDVLNIKSSVAYSKVSQALLESSSMKFTEAMKYYYEALTIYKAIYTIRKKNGANYSSPVIRTIKAIAFTFKGVAYLWLKMGYAQNAIKFNYLALQNENKIYESKKDMFWSNHLEVLQILKEIVILLRCIANAYLQLSMKSSDEEGNQWLKKSLEIYENIYRRVFHIYGEKYYLTTSTMYNIGFLKYRLGKLEEANTIVQKLYNIQIELSDESDYKVLSTTNLLKKINNPSSCMFPRPRVEGRGLYLNTRSIRGCYSMN